MSELDTQDRERLRSNQFAYVDRAGGEHLPINDAAHVRNAIARFNQTEFESTDVAGNLLAIDDWHTRS